MVENDIHIPNVSISYSWNDFKIADKIEQFLKSAGIPVTRDIEMEYKDSLRNFMNNIAKQDYVCLLISDAYLRSPNCMYEVLKVLEEKDFEKKILPLIVSGTSIFQPEGRLKIIEFWDKKLTNLNESIKNLSNLANTNGILDDLNHYNKIRSSIDKFIHWIKDLNCKSFEEIEKQQFKPILDFIGISQKDIQNMITELIKISDIEQKEIEIDKLIKKYPKNGNFLHLKGIFAIEENKYKKGQEIFTEILKSNPNVSELYNNLGLCYRGQGLFKDALAIFNEGIKVNHKDAMIYNNLGLLFKEDFKNNIKAKDYYELSLKCDEMSGASHFNYAQLLTEENNLETAKFHYEKAITIYEKTATRARLARAYYGIAHFYHIHYKDFDTAKKFYEFSLKIDSKDFKTNCNYAALLKNHFSDYYNASVYYQKALEDNFKDKLTHNNLGNLYFQNLDKPDLAKFHYMKAIEFDADYFDSYFGLSRLLATKFKSYEEAKKLLEKALEINPDSAKAHIEYGWLIKEYFALHEEAKLHYLMAIELDEKEHDLKRDFYFVGDPLGGKWNKGKRILKNHVTNMKLGSVLSTSTICLASWFLSKTSAS